MVRLATMTVGGPETDGKLCDRGGPHPACDVLSVKMGAMMGGMVGLSIVSGQCLLLGS